VQAAATLGAVGGKSGGTDNAAQGSFSTTPGAINVATILDAARTFAAGKY
jgi:hypothetical protein